MNKKLDHQYLVDAMNNRIESIESKVGGIARQWSKLLSLLFVTSMYLIAIGTAYAAVETFRTHPSISNTSTPALYLAFIGDLVVLGFLLFVLNHILGHTSYLDLCCTRAELIHV